MMKKFLYKSSLLLIAFFMVHSVSAQVEKTKKINKSFEVSASNLLTLATKYGDVHINSWDKNSIEVEVVITAKKRNESRAMEALEKVSIGFDQSSNEVSIETDISGSMNNNDGDKLTIDYVLNVPKSNDLDVRHAYGSMYVGDFGGKVNLKMSYGNMKVGNLSGETYIKLAYGNGEIDKMGNGELYVSYSNLNLENSGDVEISNQYSNIDIEKSGDVSLSNKYGNLSVDDINSLKGNSKYGKVSVSKLHNTLVMEISHGSGINVRWISKDFNWIDIDSSYSSSSLSFEKGFSAELEGLFKYCDLKYDKDDFDFSYVDKGNSSNEYKGKIGNGAGSNAKIKLKSDYGNIRIGYSSL